MRDRKLATQDIYPLSQTPLRFLLSDRIDLSKETNVVSVTADEFVHQRDHRGEQALIGTSRLMLMIGTKDGQLQAVDGDRRQGYDTYGRGLQCRTRPKLYRLDPAMLELVFPQSFSTNYLLGIAAARRSRQRLQCAPSGRSNRRRGFRGALRGVAILFGARSRE